MLEWLALAAVLLISGGILGARQSASPAAYTDDDAYRVYDVLLPQNSAPGTLVIQQATSGPLPTDGPGLGPENCLQPATMSEFKDAIQDYDRRNQKNWLLQRKFSISRPYELIDSRTIKIMFKRSDGWDKFYKRFPDSDGMYEMSAVGFNGDRTKAVVYFGNSCHWLCGAWKFHFLRKVNNKWEEAKEVTTCYMVS